MNVTTKITVISIALIFLFGLSSCFKTEKFSIEPEISNAVVQVLGDSAKISFDFTDGDADLGLAVSDTAGVFAPDSSFYYNIRLEYFEKDDVLGWIPGKDLIGENVVFKYRIKPISVSDNTEGISGTMDVMVEPTFRNALSAESDTVMFKITLIDRALHLSNLLSTDEVVTN